MTKTHLLLPGALSSAQVPLPGLRENGRNFTVTFSPLLHSGCVCCGHCAYVFDMCVMLSEQWSREQGFHLIIHVSHHPFVLEILFPYAPPCPQEESVSTPCKV